MSTTTIILGSGIIGVSTAYYLSLCQPGSSVHLIEPSTKLFASASGFAGGFLAANWFSQSVEALGRLSFQEHTRLAEEFDGRQMWGYSRSTALSYSASTARSKTGRGDDWLREGTSRSDVVGSLAKNDLFDVPLWLRRVPGDNVEVISTDGSVAQVDPLRLSMFLLEKCLENGVQLHHPAEAISVSKDMRDELSSIRILNLDTETESDVPCTKILVAAGAWSPQVFAALFPRASIVLPISRLAGHSLVIRPPKWRSRKEEADCHAVFMTEGNGYSPEIFSRVGGDIYIAGLNSETIPLPKHATDSKIDRTAMTKLRYTAKMLLGDSEAAELEVVREGLCFRPVTARGTPILAKLPDEKLVGIKTRGFGEGGVWLASGHGPWGISLSLGTGKVMSEMIQGRATSVDISGLSF